MGECKSVRNTVFSGKGSCVEESETIRTGVGFKPLPLSMDKELELGMRNFNSFV